MSGMIEELARLQQAENDRRAAMTPEERAKDSLAQLRYIAGVEEDHWLRGYFGLDDPA